MKLFLDIDHGLAEERIIQSLALGAEREIIVLGEQRPIGRQRIGDATAQGPAPACVQPKEDKGPTVKEVTLLLSWAQAAPASAYSRNLPTLSRPDLDRAEIGDIVVAGPASRCRSKGRFLRVVNLYPISPFLREG